MEHNDLFDLPENEKNKFRKAYNDQNLPANLETRTVQHLKSRGLVGANFTAAHKYFKLTSLIFIAAVLFVSGYYWGNTISQSPGFSNDDQYLILLYNPFNFVEGEGHAKEYGKWFRSIRSKAVEGDELKDAKWMIEVQGGKPVVHSEVNNEKATGYFIIRAGSEAEALKIAATCPHLKYKGRLEVRPIQNHN